MKPNCKMVVGMGLAAACLTTIVVGFAAHAQTSTYGVEVITNGPQSGRGEITGAWSAAQNRRDSERYESLVRANPGFRAARERKECGPIEDPGMRAECIASFDR